MSRTPLFNEVARALRIARFCEDQSSVNRGRSRRVRETEIRKCRAVRAGANG